MNKSAPKLQRRLRPVALKDVSLTGGFWKKRQDSNRTVTLPIEYQQCKNTHRIDAFKLDWKPGQPNQPHHFWDSDLAKWIEAVAYSLTTHPDAQLQSQVDQVIDLVVSAQQPDGYLNVFFTVVQPENRWKNLRDMHELYCAGHLMEAAVAYFQATGKRKLLDCLCRYADHIAQVFGPGKDQIPGYCGHPEVELALMKLYDATGMDRYQKLAEFFVTQRGRKPFFFDQEADARGDKRVQWHQTPEYFQAQTPIVKQDKMEGHAVRALYLLSGAIDVAAATANDRLLTACKRLFDNVVDQRMYITGGVGSARHNERFTTDYDLPNETAYAETCAAIALALAAHRMLHIDPDGRYGDIMEKALYNGVVSGVSLKGDRFFYANPLEVDYDALTTQAATLSAFRQPWFDCSCCPPNIARLLAEINQLFYSTADDSIYVHLYGDNCARLQVAGGAIALQQKTRYPWDQTVQLTIGAKSPARWTLALRIPGWCDQHRISINGKLVRIKPRRGYAYISRKWSDGDVVRLELPMEVRLMQTHPLCRNNSLRVAVQRGPMVYCAEQVDNGPEMAALAIPQKARWTTHSDPKMLDGALTISAKAVKQDIAEWRGQLYRTWKKPKTTPAKLKLVPYCLWGNRKVGIMRVWLPLLPAC